MRVYTWQQNAVVSSAPFEFSSCSPRDFCLSLAPGKCTALVGAGGKSSLALLAARQLALSGQAVLLSTTTKMEYLPQLQSAKEQIMTSATRGKICYAGQRLSLATASTVSKITGFTTCEWTEFSSVYDKLILEADGARRLPAKVPAPTEPVCPDIVDAIVLVWGLSALGKPCGTALQRFELLGLTAETTIKPKLAAEIIVNTYLKKFSDFRGSLTLVLNQADQTPNLEAAAELLRELLWLCARTEGQGCKRPSKFFCSQLAEAERFEALKKCEELFV